MEPEVLGGIALAAFLLLIVSGIPIVFALFIAGFGGFLVLDGWEPALVAVSSTSYNFATKYGMSVVAMFVLMGQVAYFSGVLEETFAVAQKWFGHLTGGLAISAVAASTIFAACSGSSTAAVAVIGRGAVPAMRKAGYPDTLATGVVASSGTLAALIPPSILICIYGLLVGQSIGKLLIAGIIPGIVSALIYVAMIVIRSSRVPRVAAAPWKERLGAVRHLWVVVIIVFTILGSIYFGICTPTEAGSIGALVIIILAIVMRRMTWSVFKNSLTSTVRITGMILIIVTASGVFGRLLVKSGFTAMTCGAIGELAIPRHGIFALVVLTYILLGTFLSAVGMLVVSLPIFFPVMMTLGFGPLWFGVMVIKFCEIALITPPIGMNVYVMKSVFPEISITTIFRGCIPFFVMDVLTIGVLTAFPILVTYLPSQMF